MQKMNMVGMSPCLSAILPVVILLTGPSHLLRQQFIETLQVVVFGGLRASNNNRAGMYEVIAVERTSILQRGWNYTEVLVAVHIFGAEASTTSASSDFGYSFYNLCRDRPGHVPDIKVLVKKFNLILGMWCLLSSGSTIKKLGSWCRLLEERRNSPNVKEWMRGQRSCVRVSGHDDEWILTRKQIEKVPNILGGRWIDCRTLPFVALSAVDHGVILGDVKLMTGPPSEDILLAQRCRNPTCKMLKPNGTLLKSTTATASQAVQPIGRPPAIILIINGKTSRF
ncbi:hypothetical protein C8F01DRAFT_1089911 [Mycena amicta]|nr:hypothetical protein C8F01DRAFT_1089911 [Mycena amicta]